MPEMHHKGAGNASQGEVQQACGRNIVIKPKPVNQLTSSGIFLIIG